MIFSHTYMIYIPRIVLEIIYLLQLFCLLLYSFFTSSIRPILHKLFLRLHTHILEPRSYKFLKKRSRLFLGAPHPIVIFYNISIVRCSITEDTFSQRCQWHFVDQSPSRDDNHVGDSSWHFPLTSDSKQSATLSILFRFSVGLRFFFSTCLTALKISDVRLWGH